jgi:hypothetical protein
VVMVSRWFVVGAAALAGVGLATSAALSDVSLGPEGPLRVVLTAAGTGRTADCSAAAFEGTFFDGATVTVTDAAGTVVGAGELDATGQATPDGCAWSLTFGELTGAESYVVELRREGTPPRVHTYDFTVAELEEKDWTVWVSVFA